MGKLFLILTALLGVLIVGGIGFLTVWDIPAPTARVEKVIPDARFSK